jgi:hypothetical protein
MLKAHQSLFHGALEENTGYSPARSESLSGAVKCTAPLWLIRYHLSRTEHPLNEGTNTT